MLTLIETFNAANILQPAQYPEKAMRDAVVFGPNLTITKGQSVGIKTADRKAYPFAIGNSDGTQLWVGFAMFSFKTDANGFVYYADTAAGNVRVGPWSTTPIFTSGIFIPVDVQTAATPGANVVTFTPATIEVGDIFNIIYTEPTGTAHTATFVATATTAANVSAGLIAAWNADPFLAAIATASGTVTVVLTAVVAGNDINSNLTATAVNGGAADTQTLTKANTTAQTGRVIGDIATSRPGTVLLHNGNWMIPGP